MKQILILALVLLTGCGGPSFTEDLFSSSGGSSTGGSSQETGGAFQETGGSSHSTGGESSTGGAEATGGAPQDDGGTGGALSTGGESSSTGGAPTSDGCALVTHDNGLGQTWEDCVPKNVYNLDQAMKACAASGANMCAVFSLCSVTDDTVRGYLNGSGVGQWGYYGSGAGWANTGADAVCIGAQGVYNKPWG